MAQDDAADVGGVEDLVGVGYVFDDALDGAGEFFGAADEEKDVFD